MATVRKNRSRCRYLSPDSPNSGKTNWRESASEARRPRPRQVEPLGRFGFGLLTRDFIGQPLADSTPGQLFGALHIVNAKADSVVMSKIELGDVSFQMRRADVLIDAIEA